MAANVAAIRAAMMKAIIERCQANGLAGWGQGDSEAIIGAGLSAAGLDPEAAKAISSVIEERKLCNPSQALQRFTAEKLLPERPVKRRGSAMPSLMESLKLAEEAAAKAATPPA